jgi:hypothetical protein
MAAALPPPAGARRSRAAEAERGRLAKSGWSGAGSGQTTASKARAPDVACNLGALVATVLDGDLQAGAFAASPSSQLPPPGPQATRATVRRPGVGAICSKRSLTRIGVPSQGSKGFGGVTARRPRVGARSATGRAARSGRAPPPVRCARRRAAAPARLPAAGRPGRAARRPAAFLGLPARARRVRRSSTSIPRNPTRRRWCPQKLRRTSAPGHGRENVANRRPDPRSEERS